MKQYAEIDAAPLTRHLNDKHPLWWGVVGAVTIELTVAAALLASYFYLSFGAQDWPPPGTEPPPVLWPTVNLVLLLASMGTMYWAGWGIRRGNQRILTLGVSASVLLASMVLVFRSFELRAFTFNWNDHAYGSIVWTITGFHFTHVASAIVGSAAIAFLAWRGYFTQERQLGVIVDTLYWYFVCLAWIPFYLVVYWVPRLL